MPEISAADVSDFTHGRLDADDPEVERMLSAALTTARRFTGWHVSPVISQTMTIDGPDSKILWLPTRKVVALTSITEDGTLLDPAGYSVSAGDGPGLSRPTAVRKAGAAYWSAEYGSIVVVMSHGYTELEAVDWRQAIMAMVDQMSLVPVSAGSGTSTLGLTTKEVDDVRYTWSGDYNAMAEEVLFSFSHILCDYKLPDVEFY